MKYIIDNLHARIPNSYIVNKERVIGLPSSGYKILHYNVGDTLEGSFLPSCIGNEVTEHLYFTDFVKNQFYSKGKGFTIEYRNSEDFEENDKVNLRIDNTLYKGGTEFECFLRSFIETTDRLDIESANGEVIKQAHDHWLKLKIDIVVYELNKRFFSLRKDTDQEIPKNAEIITQYLVAKSETIL